MLAFDISTLADINLFGVSSSIDSIVEFNGEAYFVADDGLTGSELWKSDGTAAGTVQVADILPGPDGSQPAELTVVGSELFFVAEDDGGELDLWKTHPVAGTTMVFDADASSVYYPQYLTESGGTLFFTAYDNDLVSPTGYELWKSDGTTAGTMLVKDINPDQTILSGPRELTDVNGTLFFTSYQNGYDNLELWKSDGTEAGTVMVKDIAIDTSDPMYPDPLVSSYPYHLTNVNGTLFFAAEDPADGVELYKSDGTEAGTVRVKDIDPIGSSYPDNLVAMGSTLFFTADDGSGPQLYKSDGTDPGTVPVVDGSGLVIANPGNLAVVGGELFFSADGVLPSTSTVVSNEPILTADNSFSDGAGGDDSEAGIFDSVADKDTGTLKTSSATLLTHDTIPNQGLIGTAGRLETIAIGDWYAHDIETTTLANDQWDWTITDAANGLQAIEFSGFATGENFNENAEGLTFELFLNGDFSTPVDSMTIIGNAMDNWESPRNANNLSLSHPGSPTTTTATVRMTFATNPPDGSGEAVLVNASLGTGDIPVGRELFKTDGTSAGTVLVKDIGLNSSSNPDKLTEANGQLFFSADEVAGTGRELWVSDGTEAGTMLLIDSLPGVDSYGAPLDGEPENLIEIGSTLFFTTKDATEDRELWKSDGTVAGTVPIENINPGTQSANVQQVTQVGNVLYFVADDGINGEAVWKFDPSESVTMVADMTPLSTDQVSGLTRFRNGVVFYNDSSGPSGGMFYFDGTTTTEFLSQRPVELDADGKMFVEVVGEDTLYFVRDDASNGEELWSSNGTAGGTALVQDLRPGATGSMPRDLIEFNGLLHFSADNGYYGREIFYAASGGEGIMLFQDINSGAASSDPSDLTVVGTRLFFSGDDGTNGRELHASPGGLFDINSGTGSSNPTELTNINGMLYFAADNGNDGFEPYKSNGTTQGTTQVANIGPLNSSSNPTGFMEVGGTVYFAADQYKTGALLERFDGIGGGAIANLLAAPNYPDMPNSTTLRTDFEAPTNIGSNYGNRMRAYVTAPATGNFRFYIASDDNGSLLVSPDTDPANAVEVATVPQWTNSREWNKFPEQMSAEIALIEGEQYYVEALSKEAGGGDNLAVGWSGPGFPNPGVITNQYLTMFGGDEDDQGTGRELWSTDGTPANTMLVEDVQPGTASSNPEPQASTGLRLLMSSIGSGNSDRELWSSGGTALNTLLVDDLNVGVEFGSNPNSFFNISGTFYFVGDNGLIGTELFQLTETAPVFGSITVGAEAGVDPPTPDPQRSTLDTVTLIISEEVDLSGSAVEIIQRETGTPVTNIILTPRYVGGQTIVDVTFGDGGVHVIDRDTDPMNPTGLLNSLEDGNYMLTLVAAEVESLATGMNLGADVVHGANEADLFFRFYGDSNGDRDTDASNLSPFGQTFRAVLGDANYNEDLDFFGDGDVDGSDLIEFGRRFRQILPWV